MPFPDPLVAAGNLQSGVLQRVSPIASKAGQIFSKASSVSTFGKKVFDLVAGKKASEQNKGLFAIETFMRASDPMFNIDWMAIVMDRTNPTGTLDWYYINALSTPALSIEPRTVFRSGKMNNYAGVLSAQDLNVTFHTDRTGKTFKFVSSWFASVYDNETGNYKLPKDYKKDVYLYLLDPAMKEVCLFKFIGCFPTSWNSYSLQGGQAGLLQTTMDLAVDSFSIGEPDVAAAQIAALSSQG